MPVKPPIDELLEFIRRGSLAFVEAIRRIIRALTDARFSLGAAEKHLADVFAKTMTLADLFGRRRSYLEMDALVSPEARAQATVPVDFESGIVKVPGRPVPPVDAPQVPLDFKTAIRQWRGKVPSVPFQAAIDDIVTREPRLLEIAPGEELTMAEKVAKLYQEEHAFAFARKTSGVVTEKVQLTIARLIEEGTARPAAVKVLAELTGWSESYADTVYGTNLSTAYSAGRIRIGLKPAVLAAMPAWEYVTANDSDVRRGRKEDGPKSGPKENHKAAHGAIFAKTDPIWDRLMPPASYRCRCQIRSVTREELERRNLLTASGEVIPFIPPGFDKFQPHPNFGQGRPDLALYRDKVAT